MSTRLTFGLMPALLLIVATALPLMAQGSGALTAPTNVTAISRERTAFVHWSAAAAAVSYRVQRSDRAFGGFADLPATPTTATEYIDPDVVTCSTYYYRVVSVGQGNQQVAAPAVSVTILPMDRKGLTTPQSACDAVNTSSSSSTPTALPTPVLPSGGMQVRGDRTPAMPTKIEAGPPPTEFMVRPQAKGRVEILFRVPVDANAYVVSRSVRGGAWSEIIKRSKQPGQDVVMTHGDGPLPPNLEIAYRVTARYPDSRAGTTEPVHSRTPDEHPANFTARQIAPGVVEFSWQSMPGAKRYEITGTGGTWSTSGTNYRASGVPAGDHWWVVTAYFELPGGGTWSTDDLTAKKVALNIGAARASGRYRVTLNGFQVHRQTVDHALQVDGKGDELYFSAFVQPISRDVPVGGGRLIDTRTYGDISGHPDRIRAGTAGATGGFVTGNKFPSIPWQRAGELKPDELPWLIWEGDLLQGENAVAIAPSVWEWDGEKSGYQSYGDAVNRSFASMNAAALLEAKLGPMQLEKQSYMSEHFTPEKSSHDRAIGVYYGKSEYVGGGDAYYFKPQYIVLTVGGIETALAARSSVGGMPAGIIPITYEDSHSREGRYTLYLQVERLQ